MKNQLTKFTQGFTLAELMAVIVIIGILAGIGLGSYRKGIDRARFSDGLTGAHAIAAAVDEYYYENREAPANVSKLAVSLKGGSISGNTVNTPNFTYTYNSSNKYVTAASKNATPAYTIVVYTDMAGGVHPDQCNGAVEFCQSMGYKTCTGTSCVK